MKKEIKAPLTLQNLLMFHDAVVPVFQKKWEIIERNEGRLKADNWTEKGKKDIKSQDRYPFSVPMIASYLQRLEGTQRKSRQMWRVNAAINPKDEIPAKIATIALKDYEYKNDMKNIETDVFRNATGINFGVDKFRVDYSSGIPVIKNDIVDIRNIVWDVNDISYSLDKVEFIAEIERKQRYEIEAELGFKLNNATDSTSLMSGRDKIDYYVSNRNGKLEYQIISIFHHYQRVRRKRYNVLFKDSKNLFNFSNIVVNKFKSKKEAQSLIDELEFNYQTNGFSFENEATIQETSSIYYDYYKFTYNELLEYEEIELDVHPYNFFFAIRVANDWISLMEFMETPQIMMDKLWMQVDYSFRKELKNIYGLNTSRFADGENVESATRKLAKTGGIIYQKGNEKIINDYSSRGFNPQYIEIISIMQGYVAETMGGNNSAGMKETANESGKAVALRQQKGDLVAFLYLDNHQRYKINKGKKLLKYIQEYDDAKRIIKVAGDELTPEEINIMMQKNIYQKSEISNNGYIKFNYPDNPLTILKDAEFELVVDTAPLADYQKAFKLNQMIQAEAKDPILAQIPVWENAKLELFGLPKQLVQKVIEQKAQIMQANQQQQQQQQQNEMEIKKLQALKGLKNVNQV